MSVITRFAPSPTGFLHIGGARTALFNYLFSKNNNGKFLLRIEDTDQKRSTSEAVQTIIEGLKWLGLKNDDTIIFQSQNITKHQEIVSKLLENEQAYYCYTPPEELQEMRKKAEKNNQVFRFQSSWRNKTLSQASTIKPVVRIKSPIEGETVINDLVQGTVKVSNSELDDLILLRSDNTPTYMLAVVVDDYNMNITHIIRGDDHLTNAFRQKIIYQAMGWKIPQFAHIPLIYGSDGTKMSKRHGATSIMEYQEMGYLAETIRNYLLRLGWSHGNNEIISDENAIKWFNIKNIGKSPARFDFSKLDNLNKHYIKEKSEEELFNLLPITLQQETNRQKILKSLKFTKERAVKISDLVEASEIYIDNFDKKINEKDLIIIKNSSVIMIELKEEISKIILWDKDNIKFIINNFAKLKNIKIKDFGPALRIALTFSSASAGGIFDIIEILEKNETLRRLNFILQYSNIN